MQTRQKSTTTRYIVEHIKRVSIKASDFLRRTFSFYKTRLGTLIDTLGKRGEIVAREYASQEMENEQIAMECEKSGDYKYNT